MKVLKTISFLLMMVCVLTVSAFATDLSNVDIEVKIDGDLIEPLSVNRVQFERGDIIDIEVRLTSLENLSDVEVMGMISGYEFNRYDPMTDTSSIFDMESDVRYKKSLSIRIPIEVDEDNYKLRIIISDRYSTIGTYDYNLKLDSPRHGFQIEDVVFSPGNVVEAGRALLTTVRIENKGERDEDSVKVSVTIPELGISASDFIDEIEYEDSETSEEMYMRIPVCTEAGDYNAVIEVRYNELREALYENAVITVIDGEACEMDVSGDDDDESTPKTVIALGATDQEVEKGKAGALYPLTITNVGSNAKAYTVTVEGTEDFASVQINPISTFILDGEDSQAVFIYLTANDDAREGQHIFTITVKSGDEVLKQIPLTASISGEAADEPKSEVSLRNTLEIGLVVLVVILIILGIILGISKIKKDDEDFGDEDSEGKTYY